jgi:probable rRNA maturation factor
MSARKISIANHHPRLRLDRRAVAKMIHVLDAGFPPSKIENPKSKTPCVPPGELSLVFLTDPALARLHADFLDDPAPTDVITFEGNPTLGSAGEICVSADAALRHVSHLPSPASRLPAFSAELTLYLVHGWLHLAGYDDLVPVKKRAMRRAEARAMELLRRHGSLPRFTLRP